ncbi:uncharacterized protein LOC129796507 isoform X2 [Lutzomyia longipalpis]|uniref:uncharacterized protein LOC129796507 isoform X2 n=1 Tax=Lutzomyia longipalpis TaxID=7200 RepID=UPI002483A954|nr:uncharacterized protein LOC129796507 isoform X2 [Lutzomyia longipalpis]
MLCTKLTDLNTDCLLHITSFLELGDLLNFEHTCRRMQQIARMQYRKYAKFTLLLREENGESARILSSIGEFIKHLEFSGGFAISRGITERILTDIVTFCTNMHMITLSREKAEQVLLLEKCEALQVICLQNCDVNKELLEGYDELKHLEIRYQE